LDTLQIDEQNKLNEENRGRMEKTQLYLHDYSFKINNQENLFKYKINNARNLLLDATEDIFIK
jgi:hypothetical protein